MPKVDLYNMNGEVVGNVDLQDEIFGLEPNSVAMHMAVVNQLANRRQGTQSTKTKSEVRGGGIKPWRQKGTGRARQGSIRSAQWIKGGIVLGPKPRSYRYTLPKKLKKVAMKSALSSKVLANNIIVIDDLSLDSIKTKNMVKILDKLNTKNALIVLENKNKRDESLAAKNQKIEIVEKSARNIPGIKTALVNTLNVFDIVKYDKFIITKDAVSKVGEVYA